MWAACERVDAGGRGVYVLTTHTSFRICEVSKMTAGRLPQSPTVRDALITYAKNTH